MSTSSTALVLAPPVKKASSTRTNYKRPSPVLIADLDDPRRVKRHKAVHDVQSFQAPTEQTQGSSSSSQRQQSPRANRREGPSTPTHRRDQEVKEQPPHEQRRRPPPFAAESTASSTSGNPFATANRTLQEMAVTIQRVLPMVQSNPKYVNKLLLWPLYSLSQKLIANVATQCVVANNNRGLPAQPWYLVSAIGPGPCIVPATDLKLLAEKAAVGGAADLVSTTTSVGTMVAAAAPPQIQTSREPLTTTTSTTTASKGCDESGVVVTVGEPAPSDAAARS